MTTNQPKDIQTALRHALRLERAKQILAEGYTFWKDPEFDIIGVCKPGRLYAHYWIHEGTCDCPDFEQYGDLCKHTLAVDIQNAEDAAIDAQAAQWAEGEANAEDFEFGCCPF